MTAWLLRGLAGAAIGGWSGWWYYKNVGCHGRICLWTSTSRTSILTGAALGWLIATSA